MNNLVLVVVTALLTSVLLQTCKPAVEPALSPADIQAITNARLIEVSDRETSFFGREFEQKFTADLNRTRYYSESYLYDSRGNVTESYGYFRDSPADTSSHAHYNRTGLSIVYRPYRTSSFTDTLRTNSIGYVLKNTFRPNLITVHPGGQYQYDYDGYLIREENRLHQSSYEGDAKITLEHTYSAGDRVRTVITAVATYDTTPRKAVITYEYDPSKYNPNLPYDNINVFGDQGLYGGVFAHYARYHFSLYGKLNRHLLVGAHVSRPTGRPAATGYEYTYTFDEKKRASSVYVVVRTPDAMALSQRLFRYADP